MKEYLNISNECVVSKLEKVERLKNLTTSEKNFFRI